MDAELDVEGLCRDFPKRIKLLKAAIFLPKANADAKLLIAIPVPLLFFSESLLTTHDLFLPIAKTVAKLLIVRFFFLNHL